ncbi:late gene regulator [Escherichia coli]|uniref:Late gene regulator n=1 Tax=Escherichia coli TaxID=562 RepID=A0A2X3KCY6_ECOLX|nr:late gene regulator [Escherichia coli]
MIYPEITGKSGEHLRLKTLESVWIQGNCVCGGVGRILATVRREICSTQLLTSKKLTKTAINEALRRMKKAGLDKPELEAFLRDMINGNQKSWLAHCTDSEALIIDRVIGEVLAGYPGLLNVLSQRYVGRGMTKRKMAELLNDAHPEWSLRTCERRIEHWLKVAEFILYKPMVMAFGIEKKVIAF